MGAMTGPAAGYCAGSRVAGVCEPCPWRSLEEIKTVCYTDAPTVAEALEKYRAGKLTEAMAADVERHWV